jgi:hypothetical protein
MLGKVPIKLISPKLLGKIITSVTLGLPEGYELAAGTRPDSVTWYYRHYKQFHTRMLTGC